MSVSAAVADKVAAASADLLSGIRERERPMVMSESSALLQALAALDQAKAAVHEAMGQPAADATSSPESARRPSHDQIKAAAAAEAVTTSQAADALSGTIVSASNKPESDVSAEEAEGMLTYVQSMSQLFADFSADDLSVLAVCAPRHSLLHPRLAS